MSDIMVGLAGAAVVVLAVSVVCVLWSVLVPSVAVSLLQAASRPASPIMDKTLFMCFFSP
jgi:hypothetical protein